MPPSDADINHGQHNNTVEIPDSVTRIGDLAFGGCKDLKAINIPNSVTNIGERAFSNSGLLTARIPNNVTVIGNQTFYNCSNLKSSTLGDNVDDVCFQMFYGCSNLISVAIGKSVTNINQEAFYGCSSLTNITIPSNVTSIGYRAFYRCSRLLDVIMYSGVSMIEYGAFEDCCNMRTFIVPNGVTSIGNWAFAGNVNLREIIFDGLPPLSIGDSVFANCANLTGYYQNSYHKEWGALIASNGKWNGIPMLTMGDYRIAFEPNGGQGVMPSCPFMFDQAQSLPTNIFRRVGYIFKGWARGDNDVVLYCDGESVINLTEDKGGIITFYAIWEKLDFSFSAGDIEIDWSYIDEDDEEYITYADSRFVITKIGHGNTCGISFSISGNGILSMQITASTEKNYDCGKIFCDDVLIKSFSGELSEEFSYAVTDGENHLWTLTYSKDGSISSGRDEVVFENIQWKQMNEKIIVTDRADNLIAIPLKWFNDYDLEVKFGSRDWNAVAYMATGKTDAGGKALTVLDDYIAGTDPTKEDDMFKVKIKIEDGKPVVEWEPELLPAEAAKRVYTIYGKAELADEWIAVEQDTAGDWRRTDNGEPVEPHFFIVGVEMR